MNDRDKAGYILLYRSVCKNKGLWDDKPFARGQAWIDLLLLANHADEDFYSPSQKRLIHGKRGCVYRSITELSQRWGWSKGKVRRFIDQLIEQQMVLVNSTPNGTVLTIVKYDDFQSRGTQNGTADDTTDDTTDGTTDRSTDGTLTEHSRNNTNNNKRIQKNSKRKNTDPLSAYTFSQEEIDRLDELGDEKAFPNQEIADLYWRKVLQIERGQIERPH